MMNDLTSLMSCFIPLLLVAPFAAIFVLLSYQSHVKTSTAWQAFATSNHLTFVPGNFLISKNAGVTGTYRRYYIQLNTLSRDRYVYTQLKLWPDHPAICDPLPQNENILDKPLDVERVASLLIPPDTEQAIKGQIYAQRRGQEILYEQRGIENNEKYLQLVLDLLDGLGNIYPVLVVLGGEAVPSLQLIASKADYQVLHHVARQLLQDIGQETKTRLKQKASRLLCPRCLVHCDAHWVSLPQWSSMTYYGCRVCGQSRDFLDLDRYWLTAVLDNKSTTEQSQQEGELRINWFIHRQLFDFDGVEIVAATDEEVERFAVQVGNDTDPARQPGYKKMSCVILSSCKLSENTKRILQRMFGQVEVKEAV